jgi:hypothetical protein
MPSNPEIQNTYISTKLATPIVLDGKTYTYALKFYPAPSRTLNGTEIVSGTIHSVVNEGSGIYRIVCVRGAQKSSYTKVISAGNSSEIEFESSCGGNIVDSKESMRVCSFNNDMAALGSLSSIRAIVGDGLKFTQAGKEIVWEIRSCEAYGERPTSVNYNPDSPKQITQYILPDITDIAVNFSTEPSTGFDEYIDNATVFYDPDDADFTGCGVFMISGGVTYTAVDRWVYENAENGNELEPNFITNDWGNGLTNSYWYNPKDYSFRLTKDCSSNGTQCLVGWWLEAEMATGIDNDNVCAIESEELYAGSDTADQYPASAFIVENDFDIFWKIEDEGIVFWRDSSEAGSAGIFVAVDDAGAISAMKRDAADGTRTVLATDSLSFPMFIRLVKTSGSVEVFIKQNSGDAWSSLAADYPTSLPDMNSGLVGIARGTIGVTRYTMGNVATADRTLYRIGESDGRQHIYRFKVFEVPQTSKTYTRASENSIVSVTNMTDDANNFSMSSDADADQRNFYYADSTTITFGSAADGEKVKIVYSAPVANPHVHGQAPRNSNNAFCSEVVEGSATFEATGDIDHNLFNWRDFIKVKVEDTSYVPAAGDSFTIVRGAGVWSQQYPPTLYWSRRNNGTGDWTAIDPADYYIRCYQGLVLLTEDFVATLPNEFCIKAEGRRYSAQGIDASVINEAKVGIEMMDNLWVEALATGGAGSLIQGYAQQSIAMTDLTCVEGGGQKGFLGTLSRCHHQYRNLDGAPGALATDPAYYGNPDGGAWFNGKNYGYTVEIIDTGNGAVNQTIVCEDATFNETYELWDTMVAGNIYYEVYPFGGAEDWNWSWTDENGVTRTFANWVGAHKTDGSTTSISATFQFQSIPVTISEVMKRLPDGCTVVSARMEIKVNSAWFHTWSKEGYLKTNLGGTGGVGDTKTYVNGQLETWFVSDPASENYPHSEVNIVPQFIREGQCNFDLVGVRVASTLVVNNYGGVEEHPTTRIISQGASHVNTTISSDQWSVIDVTGMVAQLYNMRNSLVGYDRWYLYPSAGQPSSVATAESWAGYVMGQLPTCSPSMTYSLAEGWIRTEVPSNGVFMAWETLEIGHCYAQIRFPNGQLSELVLPLITPAVD